MALWNFFSKSDDPVEKRRRELQDQQRKLAAEMAALEARLHAEQNPPPPKPPTEPAHPVWRLDEEESFIREEEMRPAATGNKRVLRAQRQRDFKVFILFLIPLALIVIWLIRRLMA